MYVVCSAPHRDVSGLGGGHHLEQEVGKVGGVGQVHPTPHHASSGTLAIEVSQRNFVKVFIIFDEGASPCSRSAAGVLATCCSQCPPTCRIKLNCSKSVLIWVKLG